MSHKFNNQVKIELDGVTLDGELVVPQQAEAIVIFADGSGRESHRAVAEALHEKQIGTLLFDLLTPDEAKNGDNGADIDRLAQRLEQSTAWLRAQEAGRNCKIGYFGAGAGTAAALRAAANQPEIGAVVSRGGRPDLAGDDTLAQVHAPTLLLVDNTDEETLRQNEQADPKLGGTHRLAVEGQQEKMVELAAQWFKDHLLY